MLTLMRIRSPRVVSTYRWSLTTGVRYERSSETTSRKITQTDTIETAAPLPVRSLKSSSVFGLKSRLRMDSTTVEGAGGGPA